MTLNGGPQFKFTPAVSFFVTCETAAEIDELWQKLSEAGAVLIPLDTYPFSEKFGWAVSGFFPDDLHINLEPIETNTYPSGVVLLRYQVKREES